MSWFWLRSRLWCYLGRHCAVLGAQIGDVKTAWCACGREVPW